MSQDDKLNYLAICEILMQERTLNGGTLPQEVESHWITVLDVHWLHMDADEQIEVEAILDKWKNE